MRPLSEMPALADDLDLNASLVPALQADAKWLCQHPTQVLRFGPEQIVAEDYALALARLVTEAKLDPTGARFRAALAQGFRAFEVFGGDNWGEVFLTSYFEPVIHGAKKKKAPYTEPLYGVPKDLVEVDLSTFADAKLQASAGGSALRGRLLASDDASKASRVVAFPDRAGITSGALKEDVQVLADPIDAFFLQIQGSGVVRLDGGSDLLGSAMPGSNGYPYGCFYRKIFCSTRFQRRK